LIFGDGPDGAREAEYRGKCKLPPSDEEWDGHLIVQAKFLQTPFAKPKENSDWLLEQIESEMKKFSRRGVPSKRIPAPDYYVLSTNIRNSGVAKKGGKDRVTIALNGYKRKLGLKGWALWDGSEIARMLDNNRDIRIGYSAWITAGDVLTEMLRSLTESEPDFNRTMLV
jgi:hypothetical protein